MPGPAIGGGAELAMACDLRVADPRTILSFRHGRMAVTTAWGLLPKLVATVGPGAASRLLLAGHEIDAPEASRLGLVDAVSEPGASLAEALAWARDVERASPGAVASLKALLADAVRPSARHRARERERFTSAWTGPDHHEAVEAFFARRAPRWRSR
jgi:enoyl-CoA hydratase/carnithine racemase